jgi:hypothetical protein
MLINVASTTAPSNQRFSFPVPPVVVDLMHLHAARPSSSSSATSLTLASSGEQNATGPVAQSISPRYLPNRCHAQPSPCMRLYATFEHHSDGNIGHFVTLRFYVVFRLDRVLDRFSVSRQALHYANLSLMDF